MKNNQTISCPGKYFSNNFVVEALRNTKNRRDYGKGTFISRTNDRGLRECRVSIEATGSLRDTFKRGIFVVTYVEQVQPGSKKVFDS